MAGTDTPVPIQQSPTEASSVTLLAYDYADPLMQAAIRRVTFRFGIGPGLLSLRIALHAIDPVNEVCGAEPLAHPYLSEIWDPRPWNLVCLYGQFGECSPSFVAWDQLILIPTHEIEDYRRVVDRSGGTMRDCHHPTRQERRPGAGFSLEVPMKSKLLLLSLLFLLSSVTLTSTVRALQAPAAPMTVAFGPKQYIRAAGRPETFTETFQYHGTSPCQIVVVNGNADGTQRISSASISLNGQQIVGPRDFNQQVGGIVKAVVLADQNQLSTTLRSKPGSFLTVSVECLAGTPPPSGGTPVPSGGTPPPSGGTPPPSGGTPPPSGGTPPPSGGTPPPSGGTVPPGSCLGSSSLSALVVGNNVTAYVPKGRWSTDTSDVSVVNVEGSSIAPTRIPTAPDAINSCASNPITGQTVCTANNNHVYILQGTALDSSVSPNPLASAGTGIIVFSGGSCTNCGVMMDSIHNKAALALSVSGVPGFQFLDLGPSPTFEPPFMSPSGMISEDPLLDPINNLLLSATEANNYEIVDVATSTSPAFFENPIPGPGEADSSSQDCSTRIALAPYEDSSPSAVYLADLTQATFAPGSPAGTWTVPATAEQVQILTNSFLASGANGSSVAQGTHTGVITGEFGGNVLTAIALPTTSGSGTPTITNWMSCAISPTFDNSLDPHAITAYQSPNTGDAIALVAGNNQTILAVVDLTLMLSLAETAPGSHLCASGTLPSTVVSFVTVP